MPALGMIVPMNGRGTPARTRIFVEGGSLQYWSQKKLRTKLSAANIRGLVRPFGAASCEINYYFEIHDKKGEKAARALERDGVHVHRTDLTTEVARAYRLKSEEALVRDARATLEQDVDHLIVICGRVFKTFYFLFAAAKRHGCKITLLSSSQEIPKKITSVIDQFATLESLWTDRGNPWPLQVFVSYSHKDETLRAELEAHLKLLHRQRVISVWTDREIVAGNEWKGEIDESLESATIILLLVSSDFIASDYCYDVEMKRALERHKNKTARVIPIIVRAVEWQSASFGKLQALPKDGKAVMAWSDRDSAWKEVAVGIRKVAERIRSAES